MNLIFFTIAHAVKGRISFTLESIIILIFHNDWMNTFLNVIPFEIQTETLLFLKLLDVKNLMLSCKHFYNLSNNNTFWKLFLSLHFEGKVFYRNNLSKELSSFIEENKTVFAGSWKKIFKFLRFNKNYHKGEEKFTDEVVFLGKGAA